MIFSPLYEHIHELSIKHPERIAVAFRDEEISFQELVEYVDRAADYLQSTGLRKGDCLALLSPPRPEALYFHLATSKIGVVMVGLNPKYQVREIDYVLDHAKPALVISIDSFDKVDFEQFLAETEAFKNNCSSLVFYNGADKSTANINTLANKPRTAPIKPRHDAQNYNRYGDDVSLLVYTSGTTGKPKGALIRSADILYRALNQAAFFPTQRPPVAINFSPINHVGGIVFRGMSQLAAGGKIVYQDKYTPDDIGRLVEQHGVNVFLFGPTAFQMLVESPRFDASLLTKIEWFIFAGAPMALSTLQWILKFTPNIGCAYGMTESVATVSMAGTHRHSLEHVAESIGVPATPGEMMVCNENGQPVDSPDTLGELYIRKEHCMIGYLNDPQATANTITADGWVKTGDSAIQLESGCFKIVGRIKEMYKSGGYNIYPREIENVLESHPDIALAAVVAIDDEKYQQVGHAFIQPKNPVFQDTETVLSWCRKNLANYKIPKKITFSPSLPLLHNGKIDKKSLLKSNN